MISFSPVKKFAMKLAYSDIEVLGEIICMAMVAKNNNIGRVLKRRGDMGNK
jgi:hypothetical protein